ncbi:MAG: DUF3093 family protein, partial [Nocardioides sp.]
MDYDERLSVPLRWWVQGTMLVASLWLALAVVVATPPAVAWTVTGLALAGLALGFVSYGSARVAVADGRLQAGKARIGLEHVGEVTPLDAEALRRL